VPNDKKLVWDNLISLFSVVYLRLTSKNHVLNTKESRFAMDALAQNLEIEKIFSKSKF